jgi:predicted MFS family arabinose efflux permease
MHSSGSGDSATTKPGGLGRLRAVAAQTFQSLEVPDFRILWFGFMGSWMAMQMQQVARGYLAYKLTGNALSLGLVTLAMGVPRIFLSPLGGVIADRFLKRTVLLWTQAFLGFAALGAAILVSMHLMTIELLMVIGFIQGTAFALNMPARQAYLPQIVGKGDQLANAIALNTAGMNLMRVVGPAIAGVLIAIPFIGVAGVYYIFAACYLWVWWSVYRIKNPGRVASVRRNVRSSLSDGFSYIWKHRILLTLMSLSFVPLAIGMPYTSLMPVIALGSLNIGSTGLGMLLTVAGTGALVGTLLVAYFSKFERKGMLQLILGMVFGVTLFGFAFGVYEGSLLIALPFLFFTGMAGDSYMALNSTLIMMNTEEAVYGRVMGVYMVTQSIRPITVLPISAIADAIGTALTLMFSGVICFTFVGSIAALLPSYRHIGENLREVPVPAD